MSKHATAIVRIGAGTCGLSAGAAKVKDALREFAEIQQQEIAIIEVGCIGLCSAEPLIDIETNGQNRLFFANVKPRDINKLMPALLAGELPEMSPLGQVETPTGKPWPDVDRLFDHPFFAPQKRQVLKHCGLIDPSSIRDYEAAQGYNALSHVLSHYTPAEVCDMVAGSGLRGRGGGGFLTGKKWRFAQTTVAKKKYLICNADEGDPGAFMDRALIEGDPHQLIEGMAIAAYAIGASHAYVYIRAEYPLAIERLVKACEDARQNGYLGKNILASDFDLDITIKKGAGAFVCGEETALIHSIEGKRGMPRPRPPYPAVSGLHGAPTVINNVETLANIPGIFRQGVEAYATSGTDTSRGTKVFALSGNVNNTGLVEVEMGLPLRAIVFDIGGGIPNQKEFKAVQIGGPSGGCIPASHLDIPVDYESLKTVGQ
jgi:NADH:ubiquinone oxidoreductase subunit F (NADH-binding)/(2Fe-2S) ferredoxin